MDFFLKAKAWQIFLLTVVAPFCIQSGLVVFFVSNIEKNPALVFKAMAFFTLVFMALLFLWIWSLGIGLNKLIPEEIRPEVKLFKLAIICSATNTILFHVYFVLFATNEVNDDYMTAMLFLYIFSICCFFYALYFVSKSLVISEQQKSTRVSLFSGNLFLFLFFPLGIWVIQPRINKIYAEKINRDIQLKRQC